MQYDSILVVCPSWVGDLVMATPALRAVRMSFPGARITALVRPYGMGVLSGGAWFDEVLPFDRRRAGMAEAARMVARLRSRGFSLALVLPNSFSAAAMAWLSGAKRRIGYSRDMRAALLTTAIPRPGEEPGGPGCFEPVYMADYYMALAQAAGAQPHGLELELHVSDGEKRAAEDLLSSLGVGQGEKIVALNPGAAFGSSKCWPPDRFAAAGDLLADAFSCRCVILAGPNERGIQGEIAALMKSSPAAPAPEKQPLDVLKAIVLRSALMVTNDTGPRHFAAALGVPSVVLMGPTDPRYTSCASEKAIVLRADVPCGPCHLKVCPTDHACMKALTPGQVLAAAKKLMGLAEREALER